MSSKPREAVQNLVSQESVMALTSNQWFNFANQFIKACKQQFKNNTANSKLNVSSRTYENKQLFLKELTKRLQTRVACSVSNIIYKH